MTADPHHGKGRCYLTKVKDTDYLYLSAMIRSLEPDLLNSRRMDRMIEARSDEDALRVLSECGYGGMESVSMDALENLLDVKRREMFKEMSDLAPDTRIVDIFRMKYDYHNIKALIKCRAVSAKPDGLLIDAGRVDVKSLSAAINQSEYQNLPVNIQPVVKSAADILAATSDPQATDIQIDNAYFKELTDTAAGTESEFLAGYVKALIDSSNLKSTVRTMRMNKGADFLRKVLAEGGSVGIEGIVSAFLSGGRLEELYSSSQLKEAAVLADTVKEGGSLTAFERLCDNAVMAYLSRVKTINFGDGVLVAYIAAKEAELTSIRIIMAGRSAGLPPDSIRERLRESYV